MHTGCNKHKFGWLPLLRCAADVAPHQVREHAGQEDGAGGAGTDQGRKKCLEKGHFFGLTRTGLGARWIGCEGAGERSWHPSCLPSEAEPRPRSFPVKIWYTWPNLPCPCPCPCPAPQHGTHAWLINTGWTGGRRVALAFNPRNYASWPCKALLLCVSLPARSLGCCQGLPTPSPYPTCGGVVVG